jgi:hypothetical protein
MNVAGAAKEVFQVLLEYDYVVKMFDADGMAVAEPSEARRMFAASPNILVSVIDADDDSHIGLLFGKSTRVNDIEGLLQSLRSVATKYNMTFEPKQYGKEIDPKDYQNLVSVSEGNLMNLCKGIYGTSKSSYVLLENAKVIVHHTRPVAQCTRTQHIGSIFIEGADGQRMQFPTADLGAALSLARHVDAGGSVHDPIGRRITCGAAPLSIFGSNPVVREFLDWADSFMPDHVLREMVEDESDAPLAEEANGDLTREDVLLPSKNQTDSLSGEIRKAVVPSNEDDHQQQVTEHVIEGGDHGLTRLRLLAGVAA